MVAKKKIVKNKEIYWIVGVMIGMLAILLIVPFIFKSINNFTYEGLSFSKERFGSIPVYHYSYYFNDAYGQKYKYNLFLRIDPRKNSVPVSGELVFRSSNYTYISLNQTGLIGCSNLSRDIGTLSSFLSENQLKVKFGVNDKNLAKDNNFTYVTCENSRTNNVIVVQSGDEAKIDNQGRCHFITVNGCDTLPAVEKFMFQAVVDAKKTR